MVSKGISSMSRILRRRKQTAIAVLLAGLCCFGAGQVGAQDTNLIITDGFNGNGPYSNTGSIHNVGGYLILGDQPGDTGTYTITGDSAQTSVNFLSGGNNGSPNGALIVGNGGMGSFTQGTNIFTDPNNAVTVAGDLVLGQQSTGNGTYTLNSGTLTVGGQFAVGGQGTGTFTQNGGTLNLANTASGNADYVPVGGLGFLPWGGALAVGGGIGNGDGSNSGGNGTYTLNDGAINTYNLLIGPTGTGTMTQSGGAVTTTYFTTGFSGNGTYNLSGGTLNAYSETVGYAGTGTFNQSGGTHTIATTLTVGDHYASNSPGYGAYNLTGGTLNSGNTTIGNGEQGDFVVSDADAPSTHTVSGNLVLGGQSGGLGTYTITGDTAQTSINFLSGGNGGSPNGALIVGDFGTGSFTQGSADGSDSPTVTVAGDLILGHQGSASSPSVADSVGTYTINGGTLTVDGSIGVGAASTATDSSGNPLNVFTQNGGTVTITGLAFGNKDYVGVGTNDHTGELFIGGAAGPNNDGGTGAYLMNGGTLNAGVIEVGHAGTGVMTQNDGTVNGASGPSGSGAWIWLGNAGGSNGTYNLNGGTINADTEEIALGGTGTFNQTAGVNNISGLLDVGYQSTQGTYNLSGTGVVNAGTTIIGDGTANGSGSLFFGAGGVLNISDTASLTTGDMRVGVLNTGTVNQSGGTVSAASLTLGEIGSVPNGAGYYNLTGTGQLNVSGDESIGMFGYGQITQGAIGDAGLTGNTVTGNLFLGALDNIHPNTGSTPRAGVYILNSGTLSTYNTIVGSLGVGTFTQSGGTHTVTNNLVVGDQSIPSDPTACGGACTSGGPSEGMYNLIGGTLSTGSTIVGNYGNGTFTQNGGTHTVTGNVTIAANPGSKGTYNLNGGVLNAASINNNDTFNYSGGSLNANINNSGVTTLSGAGTRTVNGSVINSGTFKVSAATVITGNVTNSGIYHSDPSIQTINGDFITTASGYVLAATGDVFNIGGGFLNGSTQNTLWNTDKATIGFFGSGNHAFSLAGADLGSNGYSNNFAWGELNLTGEQITLSGANAAPGGALYVDSLLGALISGNTVTNIFGSNGLNIYYMASLSDNGYLGGRTYALENGGELIPVGNPVPIPGAMWLLGSGFAGLISLRRRIRKK